MAEIQTFVCEAGGHEWTREAVRGQRPKSCPAHRTKSGGRKVEAPCSFCGALVLKAKSAVSSRRVVCSNECRSALTFGCRFPSREDFEKHCPREPRPLKADLYKARTEAEADADWQRFRPDGTKPCRACGEYLPRDAFPRDFAVRDGRFSKCRTCHTSQTEHSKALTYWLACGIDPHFCVYCGGHATTGDHVWPRKRGGVDLPWNVLPACHRHNSAKSDTPPRDFLKTLPIVPFSEGLSRWLRWEADGLLAL